MRVDTLWTNARLLTLEPSADELGTVEDGAIAALDGRILYAGPARDMPALDSVTRVDCAGRWISPGLAACRT